MLIGRGNLLPNIDDRIALSSRPRREVTLVSTGHVLYYEC